MSRNPISFEHLSSKVDELKTAVQLEVCPCISAEDQTVNGLGLVGPAVSAADSSAAVV